MKRIISVIAVLSLISALSVNCFALESDNAFINLITKQGKTVVVKEYGNFYSATENAKSGDMLEIIKDTEFSGEICCDKNITVTSGEKRESNIILNGEIKPSDVSPIEIKNVKLKDNGKKNLVTFNNIKVNGEYITVTGDVNGDKGVNLIDLVVMKKDISYSADYSVRFDVNLDLSADTNDFVLLKKILLDRFN